MYEKLHGPYPPAHPDTVALYQTQAPQLAEQLELFVCQKRQAVRDLHQLFVQHPDASLYSSLPGVGEFLAPALLAELGDDRARYPTPQILQAMAGTCPVTQRSGKQRSIRFRRACDRQFRYIATLWAGMSLQQAPWAKSYLEHFLKRGVSRPDAVRRVANRWLAILWKLWQTCTPYQEQVHLQQRLARAKPRA